MQRPRQARPGLLVLMLIFFFTAQVAASQSGGCLSCHADKRSGQQPFHSLPCSACHSGDDTATLEQDAHAGLAAYPGNLSNATRACAACHPKHVERVRAHDMSTGRGMVATTRRVLDTPDDGAAITGLGHAPADSLLRKLCAGCHLARERNTQAQSTLTRGGGCLACHLDDYPPSGHVRLTRDVPDERCFGCHSRSGRISLNYAGLAEIDPATAYDVENKARLPDGRLVRLRDPDVHHRAGLACIDCHSGGALMGTGDTGGVQCIDCHRVSSDENSQDTGDAVEKTFMRPRFLDEPLEIPAYTAASHPQADAHARLDCEACHARWAPLCYGCHMRFEQSGTQYDYLQAEATPGRWEETRWDIRNALPPLGVDTDGTIRPFVPGMIFTLEHPSLETPVSRRLFAPLSPHTTGKARSCRSCHCNPRALGLGDGVLRRTAGGWYFTPGHEATGALPLAPDAWQHWDTLGRGASTREGARPLNAPEIHGILESSGDCEAAP